MMITILLCPFSLFAQDYQTFVKKGDEYYQKFDNANALKEYEQAYQLAPNEFDVLVKLIRAYNDVAEDLDSKESQKLYFEKAAEYAELLAEKFPGKAETHYWLSMCYGNLALFRGGREKVKLSRTVEENAKKTIELDPNHAGAYVVLGVYYKELANLNRFLKVFAKAFFGGLPDGTNEDAIQALQKAIELNTSYLVYAYVQLGETYEKMKKKDKAIEQYQIALTLPVVDHMDDAWKTRAEKRLKKLEK